MTNEKEMNCEYCIVLGNENKCKALQVETHTCLGITAKNKCPIYKLKQQLQSKEQECADLKDTIKLQNKMQKEVCEEKNKEIDKLKEEKTRIEEDFAVQLQATLYHQSQWLKSEKKCINYEQILKEIRQKCEAINEE